MHDLRYKLNHFTAAFVRPNRLIRGSKNTNGLCQSTRNQCIFFKNTFKHQHLFVTHCNIDFIKQLFISNLILCIYRSHIQRPMFEMITKITNITELTASHISSERPSKLVWCDLPVNIMSQHKPL